MRLPFLTGSILPVWAAAAYEHQAIVSVWLDLSLVTLAAALLHLSSNLVNDYFDTEGTDRINRFRTPFSGGSRIILDGAMSARGVFFLALSLMALAGVIAIHFVYQGRPLVVVFGLAGALIGYFYSSRISNLMSKGWGEFCIFIAFGPLLTLGAGYALTGCIHPMQILVGAIPGYLITAVLWINQFPDYEADATTDKKNLVVRLGKAWARWPYVVLMCLPFPTIIALVSLRLLPFSTLAVILASPLVARALIVFLRVWNDPLRIVPAQALTIQCHLLVTALLALSLIVRV